MEKYLYYGQKHSIPTHQRNLNYVDEANIDELWETHIENTLLRPKICQEERLKGSCQGDLGLALTYMNNDNRLKQVCL